MQATSPPCPLQPVAAHLTVPLPLLLLWLPAPLGGPPGAPVPCCSHEDWGASPGLSLSLQVSSQLIINSFWATCSLTPPGAEGAPHQTSSVRTPMIPWVTVPCRRAHLPTGPQATYRQRPCLLSFVSRAFFVLSKRDIPWTFMEHVRETPGSYTVQCRLVVTEPVCRNYTAEGECGHGHFKSGLESRWGKNLFRMSGHCPLKSTSVVLQTRDHRPPRIPRAALSPSSRLMRPLVPHRWVGGGRAPDPPPWEDTAHPLPQNTLVGKTKLT